VLESGRLSLNLRDASSAALGSLRNAFGKRCIPNSSYWSHSHLKLLSDHLKRSNNGRRCLLRVPCATEDEPGCDKSFADTRSRLRHRAKACKSAQQLRTAFKCRCGRTVKRWYQFKCHQRICARRADSGALSCECEDSFPSFGALEGHYISEHRKLAGRPRKSDHPVISSD